MPQLRLADIYYPWPGKVLKVFWFTPEGGYLVDKLGKIPYYRYHRKRTKRYWTRYYRLALPDREEVICYKQEHQFRRWTRFVVEGGKLVVVAVGDGWPFAKPEQGEEMEPGQEV